MPLPHNTVWLNLVSLAAAVSLFEGAVTGRGTGRHWPASLRLHPLFAIVGFGLLAFVVVDLLRRFLN